ncbi:hypothetical protein [Chryseobacterium populi]|uniref:Sel1 repeat protein n=1 Tax=Chryseobacterium populi TaxID=1144316 RepID=J2JUE8_9FLAO|nr:hypothetical protein [Chryseobacterium populi]EJL71485.1 hypothetical protein PMI13_02331 [Chryseobacterium populi]
MKIFKSIVLSIFLLSTFSCNKKEHIITEQKNEDIVNSENNRFIPNDSINTLLKNALQKGDTLSYNKAYHYFAIYHYKKEFLYYSMTMANKYQYGKAYFDTHYFLRFLNHENGLETNTNLIDYYLLRAYEVGNKDAKEVVNEKYLNKGLKVPTSESVLEK